METIKKEYIAVVSELADRARLIASECKELTKGECVQQAIDDGFYYDDDRAYVLAWALETGTINWGNEVDWVDVDRMLADDIMEELK